MVGVLAGIKVLDLSWGVSGPMTAMLLGDQGAEVTRIEPPAGDPFADLSGYDVWQRGKRSARLDLRDKEDLKVFKKLVRNADVLIESFSPGTTATLGIDFEQLRECNDRLVYCTITGYGSTGRLADRPGYDALVAARTGQQWEARGIPGGTIRKLAGVPDPLADLEVPDGCWVGAPRSGPLFSAVPWVSLGAFYIATLGISAALRAREVTGRGQHVETTLLQGALFTTMFPWQRVERGESPSFASWVIDPRAPKGLFRCADGRWIHQWVPLPSFILGASRGDQLEITDEVKTPRHATMRLGLEASEMAVLQHYYPAMSEAVAKFSSDAWTAIAAEVGVALQPIRSPEEALDDPLFIQDGCVVELPNRDGRLIRAVGRTYSLSACPTDIKVGPATSGEHTDEIRREVATTVAQAATRTEIEPGRPPLARGPLTDVTVIDLGHAIAGPFGAQLLAELGASVIKVNQLHDDYWLSNHLGMSCNRGKRSITLNLKSPEGMEVLRELIRRADVLSHNMRPAAAARLGIGYEDVRALNPSIIYSIVRGFERGPRDGLIASDQTASALCGVDWMDGGLDEGGTPIWPVTSLGDTGAGALSAIGIVQALFHRDRTGEGQMVDTALIYAHLLNTSMAWKSPNGAVVAGRPRLDAMQLGWGPLYRLYETSDGWLCLAVVKEKHWRGLCAAIGDERLAEDAKFATPEARREHASDLAALLESHFMKRSAANWFNQLDALGVPCEVTHEARSREIFDDHEFHEKRWIASHVHPLLGRTETAGLLVDFSDTPGTLWGPVPLAGQHTREILADLGYDENGVNRLIADGVTTTSDAVAQTAPESTSEVIDA